ncbi:MAG: glycerol-3-phosphate dehydrogenase C-terminal domain-containing protein, partial [Anaerolineae bacterium]
TDTFFPRDPDEARPEPAEAEYLLSALEQALPAIRKARVIRAMAGVRPLIDQPGDDPRRLTRKHQVVDHAVHGAPGFLSVVGGKMVLYRLMAEEAVDQVCQVLGRPAPCRTAEEPLPGGEALADPHRLAEEYNLPLQAAVRLVSRHGARAGEVLDGVLQVPGRRTYVCLCEPVTEAEVRHAVRHEWARTLDDLRRRTRLGTGPCQGFGCTARAVAALVEEGGPGLPPAREQVRAFLQERWKGRQPVLRGLQLAQEELARAFYLGVEGLGEETGAPWEPPASLRTPLPPRRQVEGRRVVVVGGGLAGAAAALAARSLGAEVVLVRQACGATALSSGALDWPPDFPPDAAAEEALRMLLTALGEAGLPYRGGWDGPPAAVTNLGRLRPAAFLPASAAVPRESARLLVVGVQSLGEFHAPLAAQALAGEFQAEALEVALPGIQHPDTLTPFDVAHLLERPEVEREVREAVGRAVRVGRFQAVLWPGVLGLGRTAEIRATWQTAWGVPVWEALGGSPSVHGWRLQQALERALRAAGVEVVPGRAFGVHAEGREVRAVRVAWREQRVDLPAPAVVWATGRFVGGGLADDGGLREPVLGLPLEGAAEGAPPWTLTREAFGEPQPLFGVRVRTDALGRPADVHGEPVYRNLWAAGAIALGRDYADGTGLGGLCVASGVRAGWWAACGAEE